MPVNNALAESISTGQSEDPFKRVLEYGQIGQIGVRNRLMEAETGRAGAQAGEAAAAAALSNARRTQELPAQVGEIKARTGEVGARTSGINIENAQKAADFHGREAQKAQSDPSYSVDDFDTASQRAGLPAMDANLKQRLKSNPLAWQSFITRNLAGGMNTSEYSTPHNMPIDQNVMTRGGVLATVPPAEAPAAAPGAAPPAVGAPPGANPAPAPSRPGFIPATMSPQALATAKGMGEATVKQYQAAADRSAAATNSKMGLADLEKSLADVPDNGFWNGTGAGERAAMAKSVNTAAASFGLGPVFDPTKVAATEAAQKGTVKLGFDLARSLGSREAMMVVKQAIGVQPGIEQTKQGQQRIMASLNVAHQRDNDYLPFLTQYMKSNPNALPGEAQVEFNRTHPVSQYVNDAKSLGNVPLPALRDLRQHPELAPQFEQKYGPGLSRYIVGQ